MNPCDFCPNPNTCDENDMCDRAKREGPGDELRKEFEAAYRARFPSAATFQTSVFFIDDVGEYQEAKVFTAFAMWKEARFTPTQGASARPVASDSDALIRRMREKAYGANSRSVSSLKIDVSDLRALLDIATRDAAPSEPLTREQILDLCVEFGHLFINGRDSDVWGLMVHLYGLERAAIAPRGKTE